MKMTNITDPTPSSSLNEPDAQSIIYRLKRLGLTQAGLAKRLAVRPSTINNVIHSRATCFPVATHIAELLGTNVHMLWPNRYVFKPRPNHKLTTEKPEEDET